MNQAEQTELLRVLRPALKDQQKAKAKLARYFEDHLALVWSIHDVCRGANEKGVVITKLEAKGVLRELEHQHNKQYGLKWSDMTDLIQEKVLGREMTIPEIMLLVNQNKVTVDPARK